jgi:pimeloyl-ACP methyl ester carboxylesterase
MIALARYRVSYARLSRIQAPVLLLSGERSPPHYLPALDALERALPRARRAVIPRAGHAMHVDGHRAFHRAVIGFATEIGYLAGEPAAVREAAGPGRPPTGPRS